MTAYETRSLILINVFGDVRAKEEEFYVQEMWPCQPNGASPDGAGQNEARPNGFSVLNIIEILPIIYVEKQ